MIISLIVAVDEKGGIGKENQLPWHLSTDLKRFKAQTMGHTVVMGRKTYETIGRRLPGRKMVVITRQRDYSAPDCKVVHSIAEALKFAEEINESEVFIIGGGEIYKQAIEQADKIYMTTVHVDAHADVQFPPFDPDQWLVSMSENSTINSHDQFNSDFKILLRKH